MARKISLSVGILLVAFAVGALIAVLVWHESTETPAIPPETPPQEVVATPTLPVETPYRQTIGSSVDGRPIEVYTFGTGTREILFVGGVHGGYEWNSVVLAYRLIEYLTEFPETTPSMLRVSIIPTLNPDGVFEVMGTTSPFSEADVVQKETNGIGRLNANSVDLNRNFDCKWQPEAVWRGTPVSAGTSPFSEPEARALKEYVTAHSPSAVIFWHSKANAVYASECEQGILPGTRTLMNTYAQAAGYPTVDVFDAYLVTGDAEGWLASVGIPAITVELATRETMEWEKNLPGVRAVLSSYGTLEQ